MGRTLFSMFIDANLHRELKLYAVENGVSMKHLIEQGIDIILHDAKKGSEFVGKMKIDV